MLKVTINKSIHHRWTLINSITPLRKEANSHLWINPWLNRFVKLLFTYTTENVLYPQLWWYTLLFTYTSETYDRIGSSFSQWIISIPSNRGYISSFAHRLIHTHQNAIVSERKEQCNLNKAKCKPEKNQPVEVQL